MRTIKKSLMLVCEGTVTEPRYLEDLVEEVQKKAPDYFISIIPIPPKDDYEKEHRQSLPRKVAKRRVVEEVAIEPEHEFVPQEFKAQPLEYVWRARESLKVYGEAWAIFDRDEHPALKKALELANQPIDSKIVNIAFSSRSFEFWLLLHFEKYSLPFLKTTCRTRTRSVKGQKVKKKDELHQCGENKGHLLDCKGELCITGYMKEKCFIERDSDIKNIRYKDTIKDNVYIALQNAVELKRKVGRKETHALHLLNPYTDFDRLVFKLLNIDFDYQWITYEQIKNREISCSLQWSDHILSLTVENNSTRAYIFNPEDFALLDVQNNAVIFPDMSQNLLPEEKVVTSLNLNNYEDFTPVYFRVPWNNVEIGIFEL